MSDFEAIWRARFSSSSERELGEAALEFLQGISEATVDGMSTQAVEAWTRHALDRLQRCATEAQQCAILSGCACSYPVEMLDAARLAYRTTGDLRESHRILKGQFEQFLRQDLALQNSQVQWILARGWGLAGVLQADRIVATKIPKSVNLAAYLEEPNRRRRRELYCHCPRLRHMVEAGRHMPLVYCNCGAGFYKGIWEYILSQSLQVRVLCSVLAGDDVCQVEVLLPPTPLS
jgi:hypothetical protein